MLAEVRQLTGGAAPGMAAHPTGGAARSAGQASGVEGGPSRQWRIHFRPAPEMLLNGTNPLLLLGELRQLGQLAIQVDTSGIPLLSDIDPERCYLAWDMVLTTAAPREAIRDVFIFVEDDSELSIQLEPAPEPDAGLKAVAPGSVERNTPAEPKAAGPRTAAAGSTSIRVSAEKLDQLVNLVGELVTVQARLSEAAARCEDADILEVSEAVDRLTAELRENSMSIRMLPLRTTFERFRRLVHDLGIELAQGGRAGHRGRRHRAG